MKILKSILAVLIVLWRLIFPKKEPAQIIEWNPLLKFPRNESCYCGSGRKYKKCCLSTEPLGVPEDFAKEAIPLVKRIRTGRRNK